ncbi:MAG TPA: CopL family metal-binding regulatory protein [Steroidobacteraceae bacterium]|nr:CopL family metal-binding regulatory protein [Steroidobacteraceae bacterium]
MITFRALLAVVLLLNGLVMPPATALHAATGMASHTGHAPHPALADSGTDAPISHHAADMTGGDCCDAARCDCGCAASHVLTLPVSQPGTAWRTALPGFTFVVKSLPSSPLPALFRPPA